jgi:hypothetical protein
VFCDNGRVVDEKERDGDEDQNDVEDASRYEKSAVRLTSLDWEDLVSG